MVRETRFAFDPEFSTHPADEWGAAREHFTEADDRFLEQFASPKSSTPRRKENPKTRSSRRRGERRQLADADWLNPARPSRPARKSAKRRRSTGRISNRVPDRKEGACRRRG